MAVLMGIRENMDTSVKEQWGQVEYCVNTWHSYNSPVVFTHNPDFK